MPSVIAYADLPRSHSTRDGRARIDLVTEAMFGTSDLKADHITYQPGDTAAAHHHVGASHFFFVDAGSGVFHLDEEIHRLNQGDVACALDGQIHWFENDTSAIFSFYEMWVPSPADTIWAVDHDR